MSWQTTQPSLLSRVRDPADHAAWATFDRRYGDLIIRYCHRCGLQQSDAEDVRQVVMMNLARALRSFEYSPQRGRFRSYLGRVVRNAVIRHTRRPALEVRALDSGVLATNGDIDTDVDESWEQEWVRHHLRLAMATLRQTHEPRSVAVFERLLAGASVALVAGEFDMTTDAVHKIKQRVRDRLQQLVARQVRDEDEIGSTA